jgi:hypothetical protein
MKVRSVFFLCLFAALSPAAGPEHWWQREPLRLVDLVTGMDGINWAPADVVAAKKARLAFNSEHFDVMGFVPGGMDDSKIFFRTPLATRAQPDYLGQYLPEAHRRGIRPMIYLNVHWYTFEFAKRHPDWVQVTEAGKPLDNIYSTGTSFCTNSPWREWCFQLVRDLLKYPIDGIFYDGPVYFPETCYCRYCREKFQRQHGHPMPSKAARKGKAFRELVDFQASTLAEFLRDTQRIIKATNPEVAFYMNGGARGPNWATGRLNRVLAEHQDILGSEGGFISGDLNQVQLWKPGLTARLLETQAPTKPRVIFSAAAHKPWTYSVLTRPELRLLYADSIANAASVWFCFTPKELDWPELDALADMNRFVAANGRYYMNTRSEARAAIVWSDNTANVYNGSDAQLMDVDRAVGRGGPGSANAEFAGLADALIRAHVPFDVIDDDTLEREPLDRYRAIFLPNVAAMSDAVARRLTAYVRGGGNLIASFETSLYDEYGTHRSDFALAEAFGASTSGRISGPRQWDFMQRTKAPAASLLARDLAPSSVYHVRVKAAAADTLALNFKTMAGRYDGFPALSDEPAVLMNRCGKGTVLYLSGDVGATLNSFHTAEFHQLIENAVAKLAPPEVQLDSAPASLELVVRSQDNGRRLLIHLVNFTGEMTRPIRRVIPVENLRIRLPRAYASARTLVAGREVAVRGDELTVPKVSEYEVVVVE